MNTVWHCCDFEIWSRSLKVVRTRSTIMKTMTFVMVSEKTATLNFSTCRTLNQPSSLALIMTQTHTVSCESKTVVFTWKTKVVVDEKTLRKMMGVVPPALMIKGPWGLGGWHVPNKGKVYSPPTGEVTVSIARCSPSLEGSKVTSRATSVPPVEPGAAATVLSTWKSWESTWWHTKGFTLLSFKDMVSLC